MPRTVLAMVVGAALGLAGAVMQGVTRNPLADPGILGVTTGASLAVVVGLASSASPPDDGDGVAILARPGAAVLVYSIARSGAAARRR